jgi:hypothetical protein
MNNHKEFFGQPTGVTGDYTWQVNSDNTITITKYTQPSVTISSESGNNLITLVIPSVLNNLPVTIIGANSFQNSTNFITVNIPATVTSIKDSAFMGCSYLQYVGYSPNCKLSTIGPNAFNGTAIQIAIIPASVINISDGAFNVIKLNSVKFLGNRPYFDTDSFNSQTVNDNGTIANGTTATMDSDAAGKIYLYCFKDKTGFTNPNETKYELYIIPEMVFPLDSTTLNPVYPLILVVLIIVLLLYGAAKVF